MATTPGVAAAPPKPRRTWLRTSLRVLGLVAFTAAGSVAARGRPQNGIYYDGWAEIAVALFFGALIAFFVLFVVGTIGHFISTRLRHRDKDWFEITFGRAALIVTAVLLVSSAVGRASEHEESVRNATPDPTGSLTQREAANLDAANWARHIRGTTKHAQAWLAGHEAFLAGLEKDGNTAGVRAKAVRAQSHLSKSLAVLNAVPTFPEADLNAETSRFIEIVILEIRGYDLYIKGLERNAHSGIPLSDDKRSLSLLDRGDILIDKAARMSLRERKRLIALDRKYGIP